MLKLAIDLYGRCDILWGELCSRVEFGVLAHNYQDLRCLQVSSFSYTKSLSLMLLFIITANAKAQLLTVPPYAVSAVVLLITSYISDRIQSRGIPLACAAAGGGIGYL